MPPIKRKPPTQSIRASFETKGVFCVFSLTKSGTITKPKAQKGNYESVSTNPEHWAVVVVVVLAYVDVEAPSPCGTFDKEASDEWP